MDNSTAVNETVSACESLVMNTLEKGFEGAFALGPEHAVIMLLALLGGFNLLVTIVQGSLVGTMMIVERAAHIYAFFKFGKEKWRKRKWSKKTNS